jgi:phage tail-like protein
MKMPIDPYRGFNFLVRIDGITEGGFQECSGLDSQTASIDYREGDEPSHVRKVPGLNSFSPITLKRGITDSEDLWNWREAAAKGKADRRRNGTIILCDANGVEKKSWDFLNAWVSKWTGPAFSSTGNAIAIETLEITHEEIKRAGAN